MARPVRIQFPGAVYHITSRGNALQPIFEKEIADKRKRDKAIIRAQKGIGYTLTEIGKHLGLHYSTISKIVTR